MDAMLIRQGDDINTLINSFEAQLDEAYRTLSRLAVAAGDFSQMGQVGLRVGQPVLQALGRSMSLVTEARGEAISMHRSIERIGRTMGYGDSEPKPEHPFTSAEMPLTLVAEAA